MGESERNCYDEQAVSGVFLGTVESAPVELERLISFFSVNPSATLLRSPHAAYIIFFLHRHFKHAGNITIPQSALTQELAEFLDEVHESAPESLRDKPETYVTNWSTGDSRWLRRFHDARHAEPIYELTPSTEDVLKFLASVLDRNLAFVGTESRLKRIIDTLSNIVVRGSSDPGRRLEHLSDERERIDREIEAIKAGGVVETYGPTAIRERFADAVADLASLQGDFRAVEESFKNITRDVQKRQSQASDSRGNILGFALDAEGALKEKDQGISFDAFVRLVLSPSKQDELEAIVARLDEIECLAEQVEGMERIRGMMGNLSEEAEKVLRTTRRLSSTLRRLLDTRANAGRLRLAEVLRDITSAATRLAECPNPLSVDVSTQLDLLNVWERTFWTAPVEFEASELTDHEPDEDDRLAAFRRLAELQTLDWEGMRQNVANMLNGSTERVPLAQVLESHPLTTGAIEVLGYIQIAHDGGHEVDETKTEVIRLSATPGDNVSYEVPKVTFLNERLRMLRCPIPTGDGV